MSREEFAQAFPGHNSFYSYDDFIAYAPSFANRREAAAFMANIAHETGGLKILEEAGEVREPYGDPSKSYGCPAGPDAADHAAFQASAPQ